MAWLLSHVGVKNSKSEKKISALFLTENLVCDLFNENMSFNYYTETLIDNNTEIIRLKIWC
jgi:hypothetical protein